MVYKQRSTCPSLTAYYYSICFLKIAVDVFPQQFTMFLNSDRSKYVKQHTNPPLSWRKNFLVLYPCYLLPDLVAQQPGEGYSNQVLWLHGK